MNDEHAKELLALRRDIVNLIDTIGRLSIENAELKEQVAALTALLNSRNQHG